MTMIEVFLIIHRLNAPLNIVPIVACVTAWRALLVCVRLYLKYVLR